MGEVEVAPARSPFPKTTGGQDGTFGGQYNLRDEKASHYGYVKQANEHERKVAVKLDTSSGAESHHGTIRNGETERGTNDGPPIVGTSLLPLRRYSRLCWKIIKNANVQKNFNESPPMTPRCTIRP